ncbi:GntR family transcriptional regulator [Anaerotignum sp. MSJ-24]|uniref:GntR family transcriptional regulator n=1 Tax=Anaerotignum sp. MSJ-24 TaxID=2841521 RepID=UPI001C0F50DB|nr:GntR family transcriptional regulator [Anaerotignum sp. MSJ-24]MBU5464880.1 GntR family transcriptional regulator [Anaerotignum sp. MSJ-24]
MAWTFKDDRPIYSQLVEQIKIKIISSEWELGGRLSSVRELAEQAGVNPNTMQRALAELERDGLVHSKRTSGRFVTEDEDMIKGVREAVAAENIAAFMESMKRLGFTESEIMDEFKKAVSQQTV